MLAGRTLALRGMLDRRHGLCEWQAVMVACTKPGQSGRVRLAGWWRSGDTSAMRGPRHSAGGAPFREGADYPFLAPKMKDQSRWFRIGHVRRTFTVASSIGVHIF